MKKEGFLIAALGLLGLYLAVSNGRVPAAEKERNIVLRLEPVPNEVRRAGAVLPLCDFETQKEVDNWWARYYEYRSVRRKLTNLHATSGKYAMEIDWRVTRWGELIYINFPEEWALYRRFALDLFNAGGKKIRCELRLGDYFDSTNLHPETSRFVHLAWLAPGPNIVNVDMDEVAEKIRLASPRKIIHLRFFSRAPVLLYLDHVRLER
ncbi:MAG: hypothetical protein ACYC5N_04365 [Endomicrobiales bacterium]